MRAHASSRNTASTAADIKKYACDGVLYYAQHLSMRRNVIAVAVSGEKADTALISSFIWLKGADHPDPLLDLAGKPLDQLRSASDYLKLLMHDPVMLSRNQDDLMALSRKIHNFLRDYGKVTEAQKPLVISAILLALQHLPFRKSWDFMSDQDLPVETYQAVEKVVAKAMPDVDRRQLMMAAYWFLTTHPELTKPNNVAIKGRKRVFSSPLRYLIREIEENVLPFAETYDHIDIIGQFYAEFLRYTGGDGRGLGIVLTPRHLTELFVQLAEVGISDTVLDPCAGTGGFLISAMAEMDRLIGDDAEAKRKVRTSQLIGIEQQPDMFALCASNMILRGDGKTNLHRGDCFDRELQKSIIQGSSKVARPNKGLLNPPYAQKGEEQHELDFVKAMLDMLTPGGVGVAVVQMSSVNTKDPSRDRLLQSHTLVAAMTLPIELFSPVGAIPSAIVLKAHTPHARSAGPNMVWSLEGRRFY